MPTPSTSTMPTPLTTATATKKPKQRNRSGPRTRNGSYRHYYSRRHDGVQPDDRLPLLRQVCNSHPSCTLLDIGCNDGTLTTELASLTTCTRAVGVDINPNLIGDARKKLRALLDKGTRGAAAIQGPLPGFSEALPLSVRQAVHLGKEPRIRNGVLDNCLLDDCNGENKFPRNVSFRTEDFAQPEDTRTSREVVHYDIVLCLSVTKWVHFAWGDEGLMRMFRRIYQCLKPGGVLILEPQPKKSYKSAIRKGLGKKDFNGERKLRPHEFAHYLKSSIGFSDMEVLRKTQERGHAFNRPIMAFLKDALWRLPRPRTSQRLYPYNVFAEDAFHPEPGPLNNWHQHIDVVPFAPEMDINAPANGIPADPAPPNVAPANPMPVQPAPPVDATPTPPANPSQASPVNPALANAVSISATPGNAAPSVETQVVNDEEPNGHNEEAENDRGSEDGRAESSMVAHQGSTTQSNQQPVDPEESAAPLNETEHRQEDETVRVASSAAAGDGDVARRVSGCKRRRSEERTEESDERSAKVVKHDTDATKR